MQRLGTLTFDPSDTPAKTLTVTVKRRHDCRARRSLLRSFWSNPTNATIASGTGTGNITNDDSVSVTTSTLNLPINATTVTIAGLGFDPVAANKHRRFQRRRRRHGDDRDRLVTDRHILDAADSRWQPCRPLSPTNGVSSGAAVQVATVGAGRDSHPRRTCRSIPRTVDDHRIGL